MDSIGALSEIKLKRTDTTLDLSQKAKRAKEKKKRKVPKSGRDGQVFIGVVSPPFGRKFCLTARQNASPPVADSHRRGRILA